MKKTEELENARLGRWNWAAIFRPTKARVILAVVLYPVLLLLLFYSVMQIDFVSKNPLLVTIGYVVNLVPTLFIWLVIFLTTHDALPFPADVAVVFIAYCVLPGLWAYFLSCIAIGLLTARKRT